MLENLTDRLQSVIKTIRGQARFTEQNISDAMREVRIALIEADVALAVVKDFIDLKNGIKAIIFKTFSL